MGGGELAVGGGKGAGRGVSNFADRARRAAKALGTASCRAGDCGRRPRGRSPCPLSGPSDPRPTNAPNPFRKTSPGLAKRMLPPVLDRVLTPEPQPLGAAR